MRTVALFGLLLFSCEPLALLPPPTEPRPALANPSPGSTFVPYPAAPGIPRAAVSFEELSWPGTGASGAFLGIQALGRGRAVAVGEPGVAWIGDDGVKAAPLPEGVARAIWAEGPDFAVAVGAGGLAWVWNGTAWHPVPTGVNSDLLAVWGRPARGGSPRLVFAGGPRALLQLQEDRFGPVAAPAEADISGFTGAGEAIFAVGQVPARKPPDGLILRWNGHGFADACPELGCGSGITAAWAASPNDLWTAGAGGELVHYSGGMAELLPLPTRADLTALWGTGAKDLFVVGLKGTCLHYDGHTWGQACSAGERDLRAIDGLATGEAWVAGGEGTLLHLKPMELGTAGTGG